MTRPESTPSLQTGLRAEGSSSELHHRAPRVRARKPNTGASVQPAASPAGSPSEGHYLGELPRSLPPCSFLLTGQAAPHLPLGLSKPMIKSGGGWA